jgi:hypothetical protein
MVSHAPLAGAFERLSLARPDDWPALLMTTMYGFTSSYASYATHRTHSLVHHDLRSAQYCFAK